MCGQNSASAGLIGYLTAELRPKKPGRERRVHRFLPHGPLRLLPHVRNGAAQTTVCCRSVNHLAIQPRGVTSARTKNCADVNLGKERTHPPSAEHYTQQSQWGWFCIRTHLKHEHIAATHLRQIPGVDVFNPQLRLLRFTRQGCRRSTESLFPNYVFARFVLAFLLEKVTFTPGVKFILRFGVRVPEVPDAAIEDIRRGLDELGSQVLTDGPGEGDEVEIVKGAFAGMKASVTRILPAKQRAQILLEVMGQLVPAELNLDAMLFSRKRAAQIAIPRFDPGFAHRPVIAIQA
jgi:transcriptional antiterminator RfaH